MNSFIIYLFFYYVFFVRSAGTFFFDNYYYGNAVAYLLDTHSEAANFQGLFPVVSAYHYGELWLGALIVRLFGVKPIYALILCAYPIFAVLCMIGMSSICKAIAKTPDWVAAIAGFGTLFLTPWPSLLNYGQLAGAPKGLVMASFVILGAATFMDKNRILSFVILLLSVPFYSTIAPGILTFCFCFAVYEFSRQGFEWKSFLNSYTLLTLLIAVFYCLFYLLQVSLPYSEPRVFLYDGCWIHNALLFFIRRTGGFLVGSSPVLVLLFFASVKVDREERQQWIVLLVCFFISVMSSSLVGGVMKQVSRDGGQIFTNYMSATTIVVFYSALLYVCQSVCSWLSPCRRIIGQTSLSIFALLISLFSLCHFLYIHKTSDIVYPIADKKRNEQQYDTLKDSFDGKKPIFGSFFLKGERFHFKDGSLLFMMPNVLLDGVIINYDLSCLHVPETLPRVLNDSHGMALYQYVQIQKRQGTYISDEQSIIDFIKEKHIEYLIVQNIDEIPEQYRRDAERIVLFDNEIIYQIKP
jgi:hypothetical protein